jgi:hypothetical protein
MKQVPMGFLPIGSLASLFRIQCAANAGGVARKFRRDIRADTKGDQEA